MLRDPVDPNPIVFLSRWISEIANPPERPVLSLPSDVSASSRIAYCIDTNFYYSWNSSPLPSYAARFSFPKVILFKGESLL